MTAAPMPFNDLAVRIRDLYAAVRRSERLTLAGALDVGALFLDARPRIKRGWQKWVEATGCPLSTAKLYIKLAQYRAKIEAEIERIGHPISLQEARRLTRNPRNSASALTGVAKLNQKLSALLRLMVDRANVPGDGDREALSAARQVAAILRARGFGADTDIRITVKRRADMIAKERVRLAEALAKERAREAA